MKERRTSTNELVTGSNRCCIKRANSIFKENLEKRSAFSHCKLLGTEINTLANGILRQSNSTDRVFMWKHQLANFMKVILKKTEKMDGEEASTAMAAVTKDSIKITKDTAKEPSPGAKTLDGQAIRTWEISSMAKKMGTVNIPGPKQVLTEENIRTI